MSEPTPTLRVVAGRPTPEELAALVVVLSSRPAAESAPSRDSAPSGWTDRSRALGVAPAPGPGAWLASARRP